MKRCAYCGRHNEDAATVCSGCGTSRFPSQYSPAQPSRDAHLRAPKTSRRRGIKFLVGGVLGGTALVVIFSAAFHDWTYLTRWASGVLVVGLAVGYKLGTIRATRLIKQQVGLDA